LRGAGVPDRLEQPPGLHRGDRPVGPGRLGDVPDDLREVPEPAADPAPRDLLGVFADVRVEWGVRQGTGWDRGALLLRGPGADLLQEEPGRLIARRGLHLFGRPPRAVPRLHGVAAVGLP